MNANHIAEAGPSHLIPCGEVFEQSPIHGAYFEILTKYFNNVGKIGKKNPLFTIHIHPSFEPESVVVVYKSSTHSYIVEDLHSEKNIWFLLHEYAAERKLNFSYRFIEKLKNEDIEMPPISIKQTKQLPGAAAMLLNDAFAAATENSRYRPEDFENTPTILDGTMVFILSSDRACGWSYPRPAPGPAIDVELLVEFLIQFLDGQPTERNMINTAKRIIWHYTK